jgi:hypothetical protein
VITTVTGCCALLLPEKDGREKYWQAREVKRNTERKRSQGVYLFITAFLYQ